MTVDRGINGFPGIRPGEAAVKGPRPDARGKGTAKAEAGNSFARVLEQQRAGALNFSAHARRRLQERSISLGADELGKLARAVDKAAAKGCRASLLLYRDMAFVAGVNNRTIITALDQENMKEHVFTNIDSALVIE